MDEYIYVCVWSNNGCQSGQGSFACSSCFFPLNGRDVREGGKEGVWGGKSGIGWFMGVHGSMDPRGAKRDLGCVEIDPEKGRGEPRQTLIVSRRKDEEEYKFHLAES